MEKTELDEYQDWVAQTKWESTNTDWSFLWSGTALASEVGEANQIIEKVYRKHNGEFNIELKAKLADELGDILWHVANLANQIGVSLDTIIEDNISKVNARVYANSNQGSDDHSEDLLIV